MTQVIVLNKVQTYSQSFILPGSEAKNPLPAGNEMSWSDVAGLSWILLEDPVEYDK